MKPSNGQAPAPRRNLSGSQEMPKSLEVFVAVLIALSAICAGIKFACGHILHLRGPYNYTIVHGGLGDLHAFAPIMPKLHQYGFLQPYDNPLFAYPAPVALPYALIFALPHKDAAMYGAILTTFLVAALLLGRAMVRRGCRANHTFLLLAATFIMAYPVWYEWQAGNMEILIFILLATAIWTFFQDWLAAAAICIGIAASMKLYPAIFLGLFLARRQYRFVFLAILTAASVTVFSLGFITPSIAYSWHGIGRGLASYDRFTFANVSRQTTGFDHSFATLFKCGSRLIRGTQEGIGRLLNIYIVTVALLGTALFFVRIRKLPLLNQIILLTTAAVFLPPSSYDYTLMLLYVPWGLLVLFAVQTRDRHVPGLQPILICFAGLLAALSEFIFQGSVFGGQIRALIFVATFVLALRFPLQLDSLPAGVRHSPTLHPVSAIFNNSASGSL